MEHLQEMTQAITLAAIVAMKVAIWAMSEVTGPTERKNAPVATLSIGTRSRRPALKQMTLNCKGQDKDNKIFNLEMEVKSISMTKSYDICDSEKFQIHKLARI